jgi:hypothetical protein
MSDEDKTLLGGDADGDAKGDGGDDQSKTQDGDGGTGTDAGDAKAKGDADGDAKSGGDGDDGDKGDDKGGDGEGGKSKDGDGSGDGPPEAYDLKAGEDAVDAAVLETVTPVFKELGLTNEQAQKLVDMQGVLATHQTKAWDAQVEAWQGEVKKEFGDEFDATLRKAQVVIKEHGSPELRDFLNSTGFGNHPALVKLMANVAKAFGEDNLAGSGNRGGGGGESTKSREEKFYGQVDVAPTAPTS